MTEDSEVLARIDARLYSNTTRCREARERIAELMADICTCTRRIDADLAARSAAKRAEEAQAVENYLAECIGDDLDDDVVVRGDG